MWDQTVVLYTPKAKPRQGGARPEFKWDIESLSRWVRQAALKSIDPALPRCVSLSVCDGFIERASCRAASQAPID